MVSGKNIPIRNVLEQVYQGMKHRNGRKITFPKEIEVTSASDDSVYGSTRRGYMVYAEAAVVTIGKRPWLLAVGVSDGHYLMASLDCVFTAVAWPEDLPMDKMKNRSGGLLLIHATYLRNALLVGMKDGEIGYSPESPFKNKLRKMITPHAKSFIARSAMSAGRVSQKDKTIVPIRYHPALTLFLYRVFTDVLG